MGQAGQSFQLLRTGGWPALLLALGACAHGPMGLGDETGSATRVRIPDPIRTKRVAQAPSTAPTDALTLAEAYRLALARNEQVAITEAQIETAELARRSIRDGLSPTARLSATGFLRRERVTQDDIVVVNGQQAVIEASVAQPLFRRGLFTSLDAGDRGIEAARETKLRQEQTLARDVAIAFIDVLRTRKLVELAKVSADRAKTQLDNAVARTKSGTTLRNSEIQARLDTKRAAQTTVLARRDAAVAEAQFTRIVGQPPPVKLVLPEEPQLPADDQALAQARKRADITSLAKRVEEAREYANAASAERWWPRLDVAGSAQYIVPTVFGQRSVEWTVVGTLTVPLYEANQHTQNAVRENAARLAELQLAAQLRLVDEEVAGAIAQLAGSQERENFAREQLAAARELFTLVEKQFKSNAVTYLEVANAQAVLTEAESNYEVSRMERITAIYNYLFVSGSLDLTK